MRTRLIVTWSITVLLFIVCTVALAYPISVYRQPGMFGTPPTTVSLSISQAHAICTSVIGQFATAFSGKASAGCARISGLYDVFGYCRWLAVLAAAGLTGFFWIRGTRRTTVQEQTS